VTRCIARAFLSAALLSACGGVADTVLSDGEACSLPVLEQDSFSVGSAARMVSFCTAYSGVTNDFDVIGTGVEDLQDLGCLCDVGGKLTIEDNASLKSLDLLSLASVGTLRIVDNPKLSQAAAEEFAARLEADGILGGSAEVFGNGE
jgi:hypothetical protein